jgi:hypothetical protein
LQRANPVLGDVPHLDGLGTLTPARKEPPATSRVSFKLWMSVIWSPRERIAAGRECDAHVRAELPEGQRGGLTPATSLVGE